MVYIENKIGKIDKEIFLKYITQNPRAILKTALPKVIFLVISLFLLLTKLIIWKIPLIINIKEIDHITILKNLVLLYKITIAKSINPIPVDSKFILFIYDLFIDILKFISFLILLSILT